MILGVLQLRWPVFRGPENQLRAVDRDDARAEEDDIGRVPRQTLTSSSRFGP